MARTKPEIPQAQLLASLQAKGKVLRLEDIRQIRRSVAPAVPEADVLTHLLETGGVEQVDLTSDDYPSFRRYVLKGATAFEVALSLRENSYLSHGTAVFLHGLTEQMPLRIYVNREQSPKPEPEAELQQAAIDRAFSKPPRQTNYILKGPSYEVVLLNGKSTGNLEVGTLAGPKGEQLQVTKVERTLIDIVVRPNYAGGIFQVVEAYRSAKNQVSVGILIATLKKLNYVYPYHQAIGFYMEKAGYDEKLLQRLLELGASYDFYLAHGVQKRNYSKRWRLYYPESF